MVSLLHFIIMLKKEKFRIKFKCCHLECRELNTIASKSSKQEIISTVVESKAESDRIREQVQNII